jgi:hypothetical protein
MKRKLVIMATLSQVGIAGIGTGILHPKARNRWRLIFVGLGGNLGSSAGASNDLSLQAITFNRPNIDYEDVTLDRYNSRAKVAGKHTISDCSITIEDDVTNRASYAIQLQLERQQRLIGATGPWLNTEATASSYKFGILAEMLDGNETVVESWKYEGCWLKTVDWGEMDYATGDKVTIQLTVSVDHVRQVLIPAVTGTAIGGLIQ